MANYREIVVSCKIFNGQKTSLLSRGNECGRA